MNRWRQAWGASCSEDTLEFLSSRQYHGEAVCCTYHRPRNKFDSQRLSACLHVLNCSTVQILASSVGASKTTTGCKLRTKNDIIHWFKHLVLMNNGYIVSQKLLDRTLTSAEKNRNS